MKTALIPPIPHLEEAKGREYHLTLAHLVETSPYYQAFYLSEAAQGSYVILDNSAHENSHGQPIAKLLELAPKVGAREIVIPDKLFDWKETVISACDTFQYLSEYYEDHPSPYRWMFVPQGHDEQEWRICLEELVGLISDTYKTRPSLLSQGFTLGLSKDFEVWSGGLLFLITKYLLPLREKHGCDIHLLGWGRKLWALKAINDNVGDQIRSIDSAKPVVYAFSEISLNPNCMIIPPYPKRSETYFEDILTEKQLEIARHNISVFDSITRERDHD